jgi:hypothetical protein
MSTSNEPASTALEVTVYDGTRALLTPDVDLDVRLIRVRNGRAPQSLPQSVRAPSIRFTGLDDYDDTLTTYSVLVSAAGYQGAGFYPLKLRAGQDVRLDLMLIPKAFRFDFGQASWDNLKQSQPSLYRLLRAEVIEESVARSRYESLLVPDRGPLLAALLNITTAMGQIHLRDGTVLDSVKALEWDNPEYPMKPDRFYGWAASRIIDEVGAEDSWAPEPGPGLFHSGATRSYKQTQFGEANVQLTFHEGHTRQIDGEECVLVEPDIDYYKDLGAHAVLEVLDSLITGRLTDPATVYILRWIAGREADTPSFEPPFTIVPDVHV